MTKEIREKNHACAEERLELLQAYKDHSAMILSGRNASPVSR